MLGSVGTVAATLGLLLMGAAPADFMLCFHRDGQVAVENFQELCCKTSCADTCAESTCPEKPPTDCPDDQCHDVPLTIGLSAVRVAPSVLPTAPPTFDILPIEAPPPLLTLIRRAPEPASSDLDPPRSPPLDQLRTVILRH